MKSEVKNLVHKASMLESSQTEGFSKIEAMEKDLSEARLLVGQYEAKMKSLNESIKDLDGKKTSVGGASRYLKRGCVKVKSNRTNAPSGLRRTPRRDANAIRFGATNFTASRQTSRTSCPTAG